MRVLWFSTSMDNSPDKILLFAYGSLMRGEVHHSALQSCLSLGESSTARGYRLVELQGFPCMIASGERTVIGELYQIDFARQRQLDLVKENGSLFHRRSVELESGEIAQAYLMDEAQVRGRRRLHADSWRLRFAPRSSLIRGQR